MDTSMFNTDTDRVKYAKAFHAFFIDKFNDTLEKGLEEFVISREDYDNFVAKRHLKSYAKVPLRGEGAEGADWAKFRAEVNTIRKEANVASEYGEHGEPPYRVDYENGVLVVRLLGAIIKVSNTLMVQKVTSLVNSKQKDFIKRRVYVQEHISNLPPAIQARVAIQTRLFTSMIGRVTRDLNEYMDEEADIYEEAVKRIVPQITQD